MIKCKSLNETINLAGLSVYLEQICDEIAQDRRIQIVCLRLWTRDIVS